MSALEHELTEKISQLSAEQQRRVLEFVQHLEAAPKAFYSARDLIKLPPEERERLIQAAFELAADEDFETFEAYSEEGLDDLS